MFTNLKLGKDFNIWSSWVHPQRDRLSPLSNIFGEGWRKEFSDPALPQAVLHCRREKPTERQREGKGGARAHTRTPLLPEVHASCWLQRGAPAGKLPPNACTIMGISSSFRNPCLDNDGVGASGQAIQLS